MAEGLFDFFSRARGQERRAALEGLLTQFIPPELRPQLGLLAEANPVVSMERAGQDAQTVFAPDVALMDRLAAGGRMASNMAGVVAPAVVAGRAGMPVANAVQESLMGLSASPQMAAVRDYLVDDFGGVSVPGFRVFHGSPHDFDKFSMSKIGTGEGAQAYGHGLYFAENEGVARGYRDALSSGWQFNAREPLNAAGLYGRDLDVASQMLSISHSGDAAAADWENWMGKALTPEQRAAFADAFGRKGGRMYEVNINANPEDFIDFDRPISEQPKALNALRPILGNASYSGFGVGQAIADANKYLGYADDPRRAEDLLREAGIPGIRYLDAGSRSAGDGSRNYVVFDENLIEIVRKYGIAGAATLLGISQADVVQAMQQQQQPQTSGLLGGPR